METFITVIHVVVALFMILVVLIQGGNAGGVGAAFGGGNSSGLFGAGGANTFFTRLTFGAAALFMITSIMLTVLQSQSNKTGLMKKLEATIAPSAIPAPAPVAYRNAGTSNTTAPGTAAPAANAPAPNQSTAPAGQ